MHTQLLGILYMCGVQYILRRYAILNLKRQHAS